MPKRIITYIDIPILDIIHRAHLVRRDYLYLLGRTEVLTRANMAEAFAVPFPSNSDLF
jgi:hypothetical protein